MNLRWIFALSFLLSLPIAIGTYALILWAVKPKSHAPVHLTVVAG